MKAKNFRAKARAALKGHWLAVVAVTLVAAVLGGTAFTTANIATTGAAGKSVSDIAKKDEEQQQEIDGLVDEALSYLDDDDREFLGKVVIGVLSGVLAVASISRIVKMGIGGAVAIGYASYMDHLLDGEPAKMGDLFTNFRFGKGIAMSFLRWLYTTLWTMLFIVPGIVKRYAYAMTPYILNEHPEMTAKEAITASRRMMKGHKWRLFCLDLSFIGWEILASMTCGIGDLFVRPYTECAVAAFYRDLAGRQSAPKALIAQE